jgi:hypothetical protein
MHPFIRLLPGLLVVTVSAVGILGQQAFAQCHDPPGPNEITVWQHGGFRGNCKTLGIGEYPNSGFLQPVGNDSISSLKVGSNVRAYLYEDHNYEKRVALYEAGSSHDESQSGDRALGPNVNDKTTSIIVRPSRGVRVPYIFIGDYPSNVENSFSEEIQGMCHDDLFWFITQNTLEFVPLPPPGHHVLRGRLLKIPLSSDLRTARPLAEVRIPTFLWQQGQGYVHMGDPDCANGFIFVPLEATGHFDTTQGAVAVFNASDLSFVNWDVLYVNEDNHAGWVAIDPADGVSLWTSQTDISQGSVRGKFYLYTIDWSHVVPGGGLIFRSAGLVGPYRNRFGTPLSIKGMQGGVFNTDGKILFVTNSDHDPDTDGHGLWALNKNTGELLGEAHNDYGPFRYTTFGIGLEEEGLDYFPTTSFRTPGINGELHAILLNNDVLDTDNFYMKHYELFEH